MGGAKIGEDRLGGPLDDGEGGCAGRFNSILWGPGFAHRYRTRSARARHSKRCSRRESLTPKRFLDPAVSAPSLTARPANFPQARGNAVSRSKALCRLIIEHPGTVRPTPAEVTMNKALRIIQLLVAALFLFAGLTLGTIFGAPPSAESSGGETPLDRQTEGEASMSTVSVRYIVDDVQAAVAFYTQHLGFSVTMHPGPGFAMLSRGGLRLLLNAPGAGGAGQAMPDGRRPEPGGWNRIQLEVQDLASEVQKLREAGARFRNDIVTGQGGKQILLEDPAGNPVELFEPSPKR
jgi:catechol 2,3-dioxygenase-like lactoylglutathione lyase family enzyme